MIKRDGEKVDNRQLISLDWFQLKCFETRAILSKYYILCLYTYTSIRFPNWFTYRFVCLLVSLCIDILKLKLWPLIRKPSCTYLNQNLFIYSLSWAGAYQINFSLPLSFRFLLILYGSICLAWAKTKWCWALKFDNVEIEKIPKQQYNKHDGEKKRRWSQH